MAEDFKVWFVTGTSSGFGRALAEELLARGQRVVLAARDPGAVASLVARAPERALAVALDVTDGAAIRSVVTAALERFGRVDVLVNNAGYSIIGAVEETSEPALRDVMETMFFGPVALVHELLPQMRERGAGTIVQITSVGGLTTGPGFGAYCAAKHALEGLSECMAKELAGTGVRVLLVEPGAFRTSLFGAALRRMPPLPAYAATVGGTRAFADDLEGAQAGDPAKAARAIADAVLAGAPTLRLPLGADAIAAIRAKLDEVRADVDRNEAVAAATAFEAATVRAIPS